MSKSYKRRVYQWLEYTGMMFRFPIPAIQWLTYFNAITLSIIYCIGKVKKNLCTKKN